MAWFKITSAGTAANTTPTIYPGMLQNNTGNWNPASGVINAMAPNGLNPNGSVYSHPTIGTFPVTNSVFTSTAAGPNTGVTWNPALQNIQGHQMPCQALYTPLVLPDKPTKGDTITLKYNGKEWKEIRMVYEETFHDAAKKAKSASGDFSLEEMEQAKQLIAELSHEAPEQEAELSG